MNAIAELEDRLLSERETARFLGVSRSYLANSRCFGTREGGAPAPPWIKISTGAVRYSLADLREWIAQRKECPKPFPKAI